MRKIDPAAVRDNYLIDSTRIVAHFDRITNALRDLPTCESDITLLAAQSFLALFVAFERFQSDLMLAYLNRDFSAYQRYVTTAIQNSVPGKFNAAVARLVSVTTTKKHINVDELEAIIDPSGRNLSFSTVNDMRIRAQEWLAANYRARVNSITSDEERLIDTARAIRNFIAHQSKGSKRTMNSRLATIEAPGANVGLRRGANEIHSPGTYLKAFLFDGRRRLHHYHTGLLQVSGHM